MPCLSARGQAFEKLLLADVHTALALAAKAPGEAESRLASKGSSNSALSREGGAPALDAHADAAAGERRAAGRQGQNDPPGLTRREAAAAGEQPRPPTGQEPTKSELRTSLTQGLPLRLSLP